jgi:hypothetical protein
MKLGKMFKKLEASHVVMAVAVLALAYAVYNYSVRKGSRKSHMTTQEEKHGDHSLPVPSTGPIGDESGPAPASGVQTSTPGMPKSCSPHEVVDPSQLLPSDKNSEWASMNPMGAGDIQNVQLLQAGHHIGLNTVSSSLRNANLQVRSEPANPQLDVSPWMNTTIQPDSNRRPLEIGGSN